MGTLYIIATPIGNLEDISVRAVRLLFEVDLILCEDTRQTGQLLDLVAKRYPSLVPKGAVRPRLMRYDDRLERTITPEIVGGLKEGQTIALVSDAGTPLISDPGYILVSEARKHGVPVQSIPGPSALLAALASCGLPADKFTFLGYPPEKPSNRISLFNSIRESGRVLPVTYILYCAPHKMKIVLEDMNAVFGNIRIVINRELTKIHEQTWSGSLSEAMSQSDILKGEIVICFRLS